MRKQRGFTLLEILISMSLFTVIGFAVVLMMRTGVDMWLRGSRGSLQEDRLEQSLPRLEEDLRHTLPGTRHDRIPFDPEDPDPEKQPEPLVPENRFISGYMTYRYGDKDIPCRFMAFVRDLTGLGEIETYAMRAGINPAATGYIDGINDEDEFKNSDHRPTGGRAEVLWIWLPRPNKPGKGTVYRAFRTPIGGEKTLLDPKNYAELQQVDKLIRSRALKPVFQDVILFDIYFWTQYTTTWVWSKGEPSVTAPPETAPKGRQRRPSCGPSLTWDSTRGIMRTDATEKSEMLPDNCSVVFRLAAQRLEKNSARYTFDDIWPRAVRIEFSVAEVETELAPSRGLSEADRAFTVLSSDFATGRGELDGQHMKVGEEWMRIQGRDGAHRDTFIVDARGARRTKTRAHREATPVYYGRIFDFTISIPSFRDDNS
ncbi:MAG: PulJ/GspJ family protein [Planctomycetota bacterium]|jgi:prepilin-type N-terminal cleavage/methylation domain-containing protein